MTIKDKTHALHELAEKTELSKKLASGTLSKEEYLYYLASKYLISFAIESKLTVSTDISRQQKILSDIRSVSTNIQAVHYPPKAIFYSLSLLKLSTEQLQAHYYVNYLGDLYGGKLIKAKLPYQSHHLEFDNRAECIAEVREVITETDTFVDAAKDAFQTIIEIYEQIQHLTQ